MHLEFTRFARTALVVSVGAALVSLAGCGGGGGGDGGTPAPQAPENLSLSGVVIDGPIQGATVCLDTSNNGICDAGEPASGATDAQGAYTITGLTSAQISGTPLVADIPATAIDADNPGVPIGTAYKLRAPAGKGALISPVTHLVQTGITQGHTLAQAEAAVAAQLQVAAASLYNNYLGATSGDNGALAGIVPTLVEAIQSGVVLDIRTPAASEAGYSVRFFNYTDPGNYFLRYYYSSNAPDSAGQYTYYDLRQQRVGGAPSTFPLYDSYLVATPQGWLAFDGSTPNTNTSGSPFRSTYNRGYTYVGTRSEIDVGGLPMSDAVAMTQNLNVNTFSTVTGLDASTLTGTMPAGTKLRRVTQVNLTTPVAYRVSDGFVGGGVTTLAQLIAAYPVPAAPTPSNTASMGRVQDGLRVAFGSGTAVTYYLCEFNTLTGMQSNCAAAGTGTHNLGTAVDGATPIMSFAGLPAATSAQTYTRVFVQRNGVVYYGYKEKLSNSTQTRLSRQAFEAIAPQLGITPPTLPGAASPFAGQWSASYEGGDTGSCTTITISSSGQVSGSCTSTGVGGTFSVSGTVNNSGTANFVASGGTTSGATFAGTLAGTSGSGTWSWSNTSGTWTITKTP